MRRMQFDDPTELEYKGNVFVLLRSIVNEQATYRLSITRCDAPNESSLGWSTRMSNHGDYSADDFCNLLDLALNQEHLGKLIMITIRQSSGLRAWYVCGLRFCGRQI